MEERDGLAAADAVQDLKIGTMGPLAGVGDPAFWFTLRPILGALGASLALSGSIAGPLLFFFAWNIIRYAFLWYTQEFGYKVGSSIAKDLSGGLMGKVTEGASTSRRHGSSIPREGRRSPSWNARPSRDCSRLWHPARHRRR